MPYSQPVTRELIGEGGLNALEGLHLSPGDLNYVFTVLLRGYERRVGPGYESYSQQIGILETCKLELYRRRVVPYEEFKMEKNGDV